MPLGFEDFPELNIRQFDFCTFYILYSGAREKSAISAGYAEKTAYVTASRLLTYPHIQKCIHALKQEKAKKFDITVERVLAERAKMAFANIQDLFYEDNSLKSIQEMDRDLTAAISSIDVHVDEFGMGGDPITYTKKFKMADKAKALEALEKYLGMYERDNSQKNVAAIQGLLDLIPTEIREAVTEELLKRLA